MKNLKYYIIASILLVGCQMKQKVMDASIVSMTHTNIPPGMSLKEQGSVSGKFCSQGSDRGSIGLFDQAVKSAQEQNHVDFITNASFWNEGGCIVLEGTGQKLMSQGSSSGSKNH
jgi:hypothetical protein